MSLLRAVAVVLVVLGALGAGADEGVRVDDSLASPADHHSSRTHLTDTSHQREEDPAGATPSMHGSHASKTDQKEDRDDESTSDDDYWASDDYDCENYSDYDYSDPYDYDDDYAYDNLPDQYDEDESFNDDEEAQKGKDVTQTGMEAMAEDSTADIPPPSPSHHTSSKRGSSRKGKAK